MSLMLCYLEAEVSALGLQELLSLRKTIDEKIKEYSKASNYSIPNYSFEEPQGCETMNYTLRIGDEVIFKQEDGKYYKGEIMWIFRYRVELDDRTIEPVDIGVQL